ncbi:MAG TPA: DUF488 family protein [Candidatus Dormibacteraeota bacterium]|nr:DUF488 family protein [Candidatus Dormibacteraeota bacterium]
MTARRRPAPERSYSSPACYRHEFEAAQPRHPPDIQIKRIYEPADPADGFRALVDRLWPRGLSRRRAALDAWLIELAPSTALRRWLHQDPARWPQFARRYRAELAAQREALLAVRKRAAGQRVTLLYGAREPLRNHARVLREVLRKLNIS